MKQAEIIRWLGYWQNANMVAVDEINAFDQVHLARKFCSRMRVGVFAPDLVSDLQIWRALQAMRGDHRNLDPLAPLTGSIDDLSQSVEPSA
jgi:hypothetical protein